MNSKKLTLIRLLQNTLSLRAVAIEGAEAIEHHGWKWWKNRKDLAQLQMELIDIWHFLLSELLLRNDGDQKGIKVTSESMRRL